MSYLTIEDKKTGKVEFLGDATNHLLARDYYEGRSSQTSYYIPSDNAARLAQEENAKFYRMQDTGIKAANYPNAFKFNK